LCRNALTRPLVVVVVAAAAAVFVSLLACLLLFARSYYYHWERDGAKTMRALQETQAAGNQNNGTNDYMHAYATWVAQVSFTEFTPCCKSCVCVCVMYVSLFFKSSFSVRLLLKHDI
jgi:hypothetical protein